VTERFVVIGAGTMGAGIGYVAGEGFYRWEAGPGRKVDAPSPQGDPATITSQRS
jgi:hypothetical protein